MDDGLSLRGFVPTRFCSYQVSLLFSLSPIGLPPRHATKAAFAVTLSLITPAPTMNFNLYKMSHYADLSQPVSSSNFAFQWLNNSVGMSSLRKSFNF